MIKCVINCSTNLDSSHVFFFFNFGCAGSSLQHTGASLVAAHKLLFSSLCSGVHRLSLCSA